MGALLRSAFRIALLLVIVLLAACGSSVPGNGEPPPGIKAIVDLVNEFRARPRTCGTQVMPAVAPVAWHDNLELAARRHSEYMAETGIFSHVGRGGTNVAQRARSAGYDWSWIGENIAYGYPTVADVHRGWANSPGHCMNLMQPFAVHVGVARAYSDNGVPYWTQVLARPS